MKNTPSDGSKKSKDMDNSRFLTGFDTSQKKSVSTEKFEPNKKLLKLPWLPKLPKLQDLKVKPMLIGLIAVLILFLFSGGYYLVQAGKANKAEEPVVENPSDTTNPVDTTGTVENLSGEVTVWTHAKNGFEQILPGFNKKYPNVEIKLVEMPYGEVQEEGLNVLASGEDGPDILMLESEMMKHFNMLDGFEDLLQPPYNAGQYQKDFAEGNWQRWLSLDGKKLVAFPWDMPLGVTFYRTDILEENGFPTKPDELAQFMQDPENVIEMAQTLKEKGHYIFEGSDHLVGLMDPGVGFFDRDLNFLRNTEKFKKGLDLAKRATQLNLGLNESFWSDEGKEAIESDKLVMVYLGSWGEGTLHGRHPDLIGKWRVTRLPFGGARGMGGSALSILSQSKNKEAAWAFIEYALATSETQEEYINMSIMPTFKPFWEQFDSSEKKSEYLGGQKVNPLYETLIDEVPLKIPTTLDDKAQEIWNKGIIEAIYSNKDSAAALEQIQEEIEKELANDKQELLKKMDNQ